MILIACLMMMALHAAKLHTLRSNVRSQQVLRYRYDHQLLSTEAPSLPQREDVAKYAGKLGFDTVTYINRNRFWSKTVTVDISKYQSSDSGFTETNSTMSVNIINGIINGYLNPTKGSREDAFQAPETGMVLVPKLNLLIPIIDSQLQLQHALKMTSDAAAAYGVIDLVNNTHPDATGSNSTNPLSLIFCGFSNRAQQVNIAPCEEERPIDDARLESLDRALLAVTDVTGAQLMSAAYAGTSPARIYRSFVAPRPKAKHILEPIDRAANRTATQIMVSLRQVRADQASYLRNTDRSSYYTSLTNPYLEVPATAIEDETVSLRVPVLHPIAIVLDNVRSAFNVGSIFRSAETAGAAEVVTCGITAHPPHQKLRKTALSAVELVPTRHFEDSLAAIEVLRKEGYSIAVMETTSLSVSHTRAVYPKQLALVAGNEVTGVDPRIIEAADLVVQIPTFGVKNSLNVASAVPIVLFEVLRQWYD